MEKTITIGGKEVRMRASALIPRLYRYKFNRDMISDMKLLQKSAKEVTEAYKDGDKKEFTLEDLTVFENVAYIMAKHADKEVPESVDEWLESFDGVMSIYQALPTIFELWALNNVTTSVPRKK